ncbi:MAG TPA: hypothetical protein VKT72_14045 [Candidatus Baltobacteraceae bacterium]|nr:hypothetical protein [Candidatus Baltobacteraceae bacterium]
MQQRDVPSENQEVTGHALAPLARQSPLAVPQGGDATLALTAGKRRFFSCDVHADIANETAYPMLCIARGRSARGEVPIRGTDIWIDAYTSATLTFAVPMGIQAIMVRLLSGTAEYRADAIVGRPRIVDTIRALVGLALAGAAAVIFFAFAKPHVDALAVPSRAFAGDTVQVSYTLRGLGNARYAVSDGMRIIASGPLSGSSGSFHFVTAHSAKSYTVSVDDSGFAGTAHAQRAFQTQPLPVAPTVAAIHALSVNPAVPISGKPFVARYLSNATQGNITLVDEHGVSWSAGSYNANGTTSFVAPHVDRPTHFIVNLQVQRGSSNAAASSGIIVMPAPKPSPADNVAVAASADIVTDPAYVVGGMPFVVRLGSARGGSFSGRVVLQNAAGAQITSTSATSSAPISLIAPAVTHTTTYYVTATVVDGKSSQLVVTPIDVHASR